MTKIWIEDDAVLNWEGKPVGEVVFGMDLTQPRGYIHTIEIDQSQYGKGYGRAAVLEMERRLRAEGAKKVVLPEVLPTAAGFWERMGYKRVTVWNEEGYSRWEKRLR